MVYVIQQGKDGPVKIGYSSDPVKRLSSLQTGNPNQLQLKRVFDGGMEVEQELHTYLDDLRMRDNAEWFSPASEVLKRVEGFGDRIPIEEIKPLAYRGEMRTEVHIPSDTGAHAFFEVQKRGRYYRARWSDYSIDGYEHPRDRLLSERIQSTGMAEDLHKWFEAHKIQFPPAAELFTIGAVGNAKYITGQSVAMLRKIVLYHWGAAVKDGLPGPRWHAPPRDWPEIRLEAIQQHASKYKHGDRIDAIRERLRCRIQKYGTSNS